MKKRFREVSDANLDDDNSRPVLSDEEQESQPSTFLSRLMAKSQKVEEEEEYDGVEALMNQVPLFNSGRSTMLASLRSSEPAEAVGAVAAAEEVAVAAVPVLAAAVPAPVVVAAAAAAAVAASSPQVEREAKLEPVELEKKVEAQAEKGDKYLAAAEEDADGVPKVELFCMCQKPWNPNQFMVACDECNEWYHDVCVGMLQEELEKLDKFVCMWCLEKAKRQAARRKKWEAEKAVKAQQKKARQAQRKREIQMLQKKIRTKACKNVHCEKRALPNSKYCSDQCGLQVAEEFHAARELKLVQDAVEAAQKEQARRVDQWMAKRPNLLSECSPSEATTRDLEEILASIKEVEVLKDRVQLAETILADQIAASKVAEMRRPNSLAPSDADSTLRLDCFVCGKEVLPSAFVGHTRECMHRNEEYANSSVAQNPGKCNVLSRRTNRYCTMEKPCLFHTQGAQPDYQLLLCGFDDCQVPALQCLKHADWREVGVQGAKRALENVKLKLQLAEQKRRLAEKRIALREMELELGEIKVVDMRRKK